MRFLFIIKFFDKFIKEWCVIILFLDLRKVFDTIDRSLFNASLPKLWNKAILTLMLFIVFYKIIFS